jgi:enoyl-CoA hydratase/carnithine racemase
MGPASCQIEVIENGRVLLATMDHGHDNAVTPEMLDVLSSAIDQVEDSAEIRLAILRGKERVFSKGYDVHVIRAIPSRSAQREHLLLGNDVCSRLADSPKPWIAAINGACLGGGLELALACQFRLCIDNARLGLPELSIGLLPGLGGIHRLTKLIGRARALEMIVGGVLAPAEQALHMGLVHRVLPKADFWDGVLSFARSVAALEPALVAEALRLTALAEWQGDQDCVLETVDSILRIGPRVGSGSA